MKKGLIERLLARLIRDKQDIIGPATSGGILAEQQRKAVRLIVCFFALMILFTVLSRAAEAVTMARVSTTTRQSGTLKQDLLLTGMLEARKTKEVLLPEGIQVDEILAFPGQTVAEGDALLKLDTDSLNEAKALLGQQIALLKLQIRDMEQAETVDTNTLDRANMMLQNAQEDAERLAAQQKTALEKAKKEKSDAQRVKDAALQTLQDAKQTQAQEIKAAQNALETAQMNYDSASLAYEESADEQNKAALDAAQLELENAKSAVLSVETQQNTLVAEAQEALNTAQTALDAAIQNEEDLVRTYDDQVLEANRAIKSAQADVNAAKTDQSKAQADAVLTQAQKQVQKLEYQSQLDDKQNQLDVLESVQNGVLPSPVAGQVVSTAEHTSVRNQEITITITCDAEGLCFTASADAATAQDIQKGASGILLADGSSISVQAVVESVSAMSDGTAKIVAAVQGGTLSAGNVATLSFTSESERYSTIVPLEALRNVNGKNVVYVLRETQTITGTEQRVAAVEVTVRDTSAENAAVEGALTQDDRIISASTKPIKEGDKVRVEE